MCQQQISCQEKEEEEEDLSWGFSLFCTPERANFSATFQAVWQVHESVCDLGGKKWTPSRIKVRRLMMGRQDVYFSLVQQKSFNYSNFGSFSKCCSRMTSSEWLLNLLRWLFWWGRYWWGRYWCVEAALTSVLRLFVRLMSSVWERKGPIYTSHQFLSVSSLFLSALVPSSSRPDWVFVGVW